MKTELYLDKEDLLFYKDDELEDYIKNYTSPQTLQELQLVISIFNKNGFNEYVLDFQNAISEPEHETDMNKKVDEIIELVVHYSKEFLKTRGIIIEDDVESLSDMVNLLIAVDKLTNLGENDIILLDSVLTDVDEDVISRFVKIMVILNPAIEESKLHNIISNVVPSLVTKVENLVKERIKHIDLVTTDVDEVDMETINLLTELIDILTKSGYKRLPDMLNALISNPGLIIGYKLNVADYLSFVTKKANNFFKEYGYEEDGINLILDCVAEHLLLNILDDETEIEETYEFFKDLPDEELKLDKEYKPYLDKVYNRINSLIENGYIRIIKKLERKFIGDEDDKE